MLILVSKRPDDRYIGAARLCLRDMPLDPWVGIGDPVLGSLSEKLS